MSFKHFYQPDIDLALLTMRRDLELSTPAEIRPPLLWIGVLASGVEGAEEVIRYLLAGADTVMTTSALLRHGIGHMRGLLRGLIEWLDARSLAGIGDIRGKPSHRNVADPAAFERANYINVRQGWSGDYRRRRRTIRPPVAAILRWAGPWRPLHVSRRCCARSGPARPASNMASPNYARRSGRYDVRSA